MRAGSGDARKNVSWRFALSSAVVLFLFAACGFYSSQFYADQGYRANFVGVPFALLCGALYVRKTSELPAILVIACVWMCARFAAVFTNMAMTIDHANFLSMGMGGLIGGFGVAMAVGIARPNIRSRWKLITAAVIGLLAALPFEPWLSARKFGLYDPPALTPAQEAALQYPFAVWQAAVGTYVYGASRVARERPNRDVLLH